jgi:hypothetical protein
LQVGNGNQKTKKQTNKKNAGQPAIFFISPDIMILIAIIVVLVIVQLYTSGNLDGQLDQFGLGQFRWRAATPALHSGIDLSGGRAPGQMVDTNPVWPSPASEAVPVSTVPKTIEQITKEGGSYADLYSDENLAGTRTRAANSDVYVFCSQVGGVKTWNFKSIEAPRNQILCFFSRSRSGGDSSARFVIINRPIRSLNSFLEMYPEITRGNTGIMLYGWEHMDLDFVVMPVVEEVYRKMLITRLTACHKLCAAWEYDAKQTDEFCQFSDPVS